MNFLCCLDDGWRRAEVRKQKLNGLDWLEVEPAQTELRVGFLGWAPGELSPAHIRITGGRRERNIKVTEVRFERSGEEDLDDVMVVTVDRPGDYSTYRLEIIELDDRGRPTGRAPRGFDPRYTGLDFSFKASCPSDQDPADQAACPEVQHDLAAISYLAKDYESFRQLMLDRMALTAPHWNERHAPDLGITLVEILAYAADDLSYYQDAVATEAYLGTARLRESVARHVRLVDYRMDEGISARGWVRLALEGADTLELDPADVMFATALASAPGPMVRLEEVTIALDAVIFEPSANGGPIRLRHAHNLIDFYDWGGTECCLLAGATRATLKDPGKLPPKTPSPPTRPGRRARSTRNPQYSADIASGVAEGRWHQLQLSAGDVLILAERFGPHTGLEEDADPARRHAVRLTAADYSWDPLTGALLVEVSWCPEDALPFPLCMSSTTQAPDCQPVVGVSVAYGNIVAVDDGRSVEDDLDLVAIAEVEEQCPGPCEPSEVSVVVRRYRPELPRGAPAYVGVAGASLVDGCGGCGGLAASARGAAGASSAIPAIFLRSVTKLGSQEFSHEWLPRADLLDSGPDDRHFAVETDEEGGASLRFGDGVYGRAPEPGELFRAFYRIGGGSRGNIGADTLQQIIFRNAFPEGVLLGLENPLPMLGGRNRETAASARMRAPFAYRRRLERAITADDYAAIVTRDFPAIVQRAAARLRSTGVRTEVEVAIDPFGSTEVSSELLGCIERHLERYRRIGHDVRVVAAQYVPIDLGLEICVAAGFIAEDVGAEVHQKLGTGPGGFFNPDGLSFGDSISLSRIVAAVHSVEGVADVTVTTLNPLFEAASGEIEAGLLEIGSSQIPLLAQDPDAPENGRLVIVLKGGR